MNVPPLRAISMAMAVRRCDTERISRFSTARASPEATERCIRQLLAPYHPVGSQGDNQLNDYAKYTHIAGHFDGHCDVAVIP